jgi:hypothetical protein
MKEETAGPQSLGNVVGLGCEIIQRMERTTEGKDCWVLCS